MQKMTFFFFIKGHVTVSTPFLGFCHLHPGPPLGPMCTPRRCPCWVQDDKGTPEVSTAQWPRSAAGSGASSVGGRETPLRP